MTKLSLQSIQDGIVRRIASWGRTRAAAETKRPTPSSRTAALSDFDAPTLRNISQHLPNRGRESAAAETRPVQRAIFENERPSLPSHENLSHWRRVGQEKYPLPEGAGPMFGLGPDQERELKKGLQAAYAYLRKADPDLTAEELNAFNMGDLKKGHPAYLPAQKALELLESASGSSFSGSVRAKLVAHLMLSVKNGWERYAGNAAVKLDVLHWRRVGRENYPLPQGAGPKHRKEALQAAFAFLQSAPVKVSPRDIQKASRHELPRNHPSFVPATQAIEILDQASRGGEGRSALLSLLSTHLQRALELGWQSYTVWSQTL